MEGKGVDGRERGRWKGKEGKTMKWEVEGDERMWRKSREGACKKREKWRRSLLGLGQSFNQPVCLPH